MHDCMQICICVCASKTMFCVMFFVFVVIPHSACDIENKRSFIKVNMDTCVYTLQQFRSENRVNLVQYSTAQRFPLHRK